MQDDNNQTIEPIKEPTPIEQPPGISGIETYDDDFSEEYYGEGFKDVVANFQREHPFIFFGALAVFFFLIIMAIASPFLIFGNKNKDTDEQSGNEQTQIEGETNNSPVTSSGLIEGINAAFYFEDITNLNALSVANLNYLDVDQRYSSKVYLAEELIMTRQMEEAVGIDIQELMTQSQNKEKDYQTYLESLQKLEQQASEKYLGLIETHEVFVERISLTEDQIDGTMTTLNSALENGSYEQIEDSLEQYVLLKESLAKLQVREQLNADVLSSMKTPLYKIRARIAGLMANKELVIQNLTVVDVDGAGLLLIESGELDKLYPPLPGTEEVESERRTNSSPYFNNSGGGDSTALPSDDNIPRIHIYGEEQLLEDIKNSGI